MVTISLPKDLEAWAREQVARGRAESIESLVAQALHEKRMFANHAPLIADAYAQAARGELFDESVVNEELDRWIAEDIAAGG